MHLPVLQKEVLWHLQPKPNENFIDCTIGNGGHSSAILEKTGPRGKILGIDRDPKQIENCKLKIGNLKTRAILVCDNFACLQEIVKKNRFKPVHGILFDLGMSSWHLSESGRGFSFQKKEPLDMRYNSASQLTAEKIVNYWSKIELEKILKEYGQEKKAGKIAQKIIEARQVKPIKTTAQLRQIVSQARTAPQRTFQALRIAVNDELNNIKKALPQAQDVLKPGGRLVVISFHSLEDRIVKDFFKQPGHGGGDGLKILTKKPVTPDLKEIRVNPRARSAKLRACQKV